MLIEKLLLHVLIILLPIFIYKVFFEDKSSKQIRLLFGITEGIAAFLCMMFPYHSLGMFWDLRYVPLVLSILYGGPFAGMVVLASILVTRTFIGGDFLYLPYSIAILASIVPFIYAKTFWKRNSKERIRTTSFVGLWPIVVMYPSIIIYVMTENESFTISQAFWLVTIIGMINFLGIFLASILIESTIERRLLKKEIQRAERLNILGELAASLAHEVRNPLTVVKGFLQMMHSEEKKEKESYLPLVLSELARAEAIITNYLNFARPQFEKIEEVNLNDVILDVIQLLVPLASKDGVQLTHHLKDTSFMITDRDQLKQAFVNIIKNGIEATNEGGNVHVELVHQSERTIIRVKDTGRGMDSEQLSRIGTLFYTTKDKGTGVGTTVSTRIIHAMNGTIQYNSEVNKGTEVRIELPAICMLPT